MLQLWEDVWKALLRVQPAFQGTIGGPKASWRIHPKNFKDPGECEPLPGNINLSPAWFQQWMLRQGILRESQFGKDSQIEHLHRREARLRV